MSDKDMRQLTKLLAWSLFVLGLIVLFTTFLTYTQPYHDGSMNFASWFGVGGVLTGIGSLWLWSNNRTKKRKEAEQQAAYQKASTHYREQEQEAAIPKGTNTVFHINSIGLSGLIRQCRYYVWRDGNSLCFFPNSPQTDAFQGYGTNSTLKVALPLTEISAYETGGRKYSTTKTTGAGGPGDVLIGGILFGAPGAVLGAIKTGKTETTEHDERYTVIALKEDRYIGLLFNDFKVLEELIPEKEKTIVEELRRRKILDEQWRHIQGAMPQTTELISAYPTIPESSSVIQDEIPAKQASSDEPQPPRQRRVERHIG